MILKGRYGPYIKYAGKNITLPKEMTPEAVTLAEIIPLLPAPGGKKGGKKKPAAKKAAPKKAAAAKPVAKKAPAKKVAAKKPTAKKAS